MSLLETSESEAIDSPTPRIEAKTPHCKRYNPVMELTVVGARDRVCTYCRKWHTKHEGQATERKDAKGNKKNI